MDILQTYASDNKDKDINVNISKKDFEDIYLSEQNLSLIPSLNSNIENAGKKIYNNNENLRNLALVMEYPIFKDFFDKNFYNLSNIDTILMFMYTYRYIDLILSKKYENKVDDTKEITSIKKFNIYHKLYIINFLIKNPKTRNIIVNNFLKLKNISPQT